MVVAKHERVEECPYCKETLVITRTIGQKAVASEMKSGNTHLCWDLPEDANLVVIDD